MLFLCLNGYVGYPISIRDVTKSYYISGCKLHISSRFCRVELDLNPLEPILASFVGFIGPLSDYLQISSFTLEIFNP